MGLKITSGSLELVASGVARTGFENRLKFDFGDMWFEFVFEESSEKGNADYQVTEDGLGLTCTVKMRGEVYGVSSPIELGEYNERRFYVSYEVRRPSQEHKIWVVNYSFYAGEMINDQA